MKAKNLTEKALAIVENAKARAPSEREQRKYDAYILRIRGYPVELIAEQMGVTRAMAYRYLEQVRRERPELQQVMSEFLLVSLDQLEYQYMQLDPGRSRGDVMAHKVSKELIELRAKLLGAFNVNLNVSTAAPVMYQIVGVEDDDGE